MTTKTTETTDPPSPPEGWQLYVWLPSTHHQAFSVIVARSLDEAREVVWEEPVPTGIKAIVSTAPPDHVLPAPTGFFVLRPAGAALPPAQQTDHL